tara:strand:+ start:783 stop:1052 length:270 start_codon:yes stop_codon:yes gene_type:complete
MDIKFETRRPHPRSLKEYLSSDAVAKYVGCTRRTVNRYLNKLPDLGIKVYSASGKCQRVLKREDALWLYDHIKHRHTSTNKTKAKNVKK